MGEKGYINEHIILGGGSVTKFQNSCPNQQNISKIGLC
jgi:hypothetical protein